ncbi:hypothetical protein T03_5691 [Trichinella britovi]|uniref:Uncharacterized protein n=1 Tax=Trichinella britovi TaxID=45882 RepID=A0A0V0Z1E1_TRIBR|nr:hypothetical protein T03_5691 [Trichinella britovi]
MTNDMGHSFLIASQRGLENAMKTLSNSEFEAGFDYERTQIDIDLDL